MKISVFYLAMAILVVRICVSCDNNKPVKAGMSKIDTAFIVGYYVPPQNNDLVSGRLLRFIGDIIIIDTNNIQSNKIVKDSNYYVFSPVNRIKDSLGNFVKNSLGKDSIVPANLFIDKSKVWDTGIKIDTAKINKLASMVNRPYQFPDTPWISYKDLKK